MAGLLTTLFADRETYLTHRIGEINAVNKFPLDYYIDRNELIANLNDSCSTLITGGSEEERAIVILGFLRMNKGLTFVIHNGNPYLHMKSFRRYGIAASAWDDDIYMGMSKAEILSSLLNEDVNKDLLSFYSFAFEVCEVLGYPVSIDGINSIDWLGINWQQELLGVRDKRDQALDLLKRFDAEMAKKSVEGMCRIERLSRGKSTKGIGYKDAVRDGTVLVKEVFGSTSVSASQCLEIINTEAEKGRYCTVIIDEVFIKEASVIKDRYRNVRLVISGNDLTEHDENLRLTKGKTNMIAFRQDRYDSAKAISEKFFGSYDRKVKDISAGYSNSFMKPRTYNHEVVIRNEKDLRLDPNILMRLALSQAVARLSNGSEGMFSIA